MIIPLMTEDQRNAARRKSLLDHIRLLERRYSEPERHEAVKLLKELLFKIPVGRDDLQTEVRIQEVDNRIPPQDINIEEGILARCLMNDTEDALERLAPDDFYRTGHQKIFKTILALVAQKQPVDLRTVVSAMRDKGELEEIGGAAYIARLTDEIPLPVSSAVARIILFNALDALSFGSSKIR